MIKTHKKNIFFTIIKIETEYKLIQSINKNYNSISW